MKTLKFVRRTKQGLYVFKRARICDEVIEFVGLGKIGRLFGIKIQFPLAFIDKTDLEFINKLGKEKLK